MDGLRRLDLLVKSSSRHRHKHHDREALATMARRMGVPRSPRGNPAVREVENEPASRIFDQFCAANTFHGITSSFQELCDMLEMQPTDHCIFYKQLKQRLTSWKAQSLWARLDKRASNKEYKKAVACSKTRVLVIGAGPCGLRIAIEIALLGGKAVVVEKRDRFTRNSVLHLWPFLIHDLKALGAKKFFGKFCAGSIDHISIRTLQYILLKVALLVGVEVHTGVEYKGVKEPPEDQTEKIGWRAQVVPPEHPVSEFDFDVLIGCDGKRNTVAGFKRKEFRGKLAIAITANFINRFTQAEARVEEISGVAYIFNQKFFKDLNKKSGIDLENIVYYKDETHYFIMTAKKHSLLSKGVLIQDHDDPEMLLSKDNVDQAALEAYAREAANISTNEMLPTLDYAHNHYGQPDVAMFDFTSIFQAVHASKVLECRGYRLLMGLAGDSLLEPFWPIGSGCARGFIGCLDAAWMVRSWASETMTPLEVMAERESIYQLLSQTTPENLNKNFGQYTIDPNTRYPNLNPMCIRPYQVRGQYEGVDPQYLDNIVKISEQNSKRYEWMRDSHLLLKWFQKQLEPYRHVVKVLDWTSSFRNGLALCALIHKYRPELIDIYSLDTNMVAANNDKAFQLAEKEFGITPMMTGQDMAMNEVPNKITMVSYLSQFYELFRKESIQPAKITRTPENIPINVAVGMRSSKPKTTSARLAYLNRISSRLRQKRQQKGSMGRTWSSSEDILDYVDDEKEPHGKENNSERLKRYRQPLYTHGLAKKRITEMNNDVGVDDESVVLANYGKFENTDLARISQVSRLDRTKKDIAMRREMAGLNTGVRGKNKVSALAEDLSQRMAVKGVAIDDTHLRSKHKHDRITAMAKDLDDKFADEVAAPEKKKKNPKPLIMGKAHPADPCYFCKKKVYLVEKHTAEGLTFHRTCFRCDYCQTNLRIGGYAFHRGENTEAKFYCFQHYGLKKPVRRPRKRSHGDKTSGKASSSPPSQQDMPDSMGVPDKMETDNLDVTPERIEYVTESEQEESEMEQTAHNLSASLLDIGSESDESDSTDEDELDWSDDERSDEEVSWVELARSYNKQIRRRRERRSSCEADDSSTETETVGDGSDADQDTDDTETERDIVADVSCQMMPRVFAAKKMKTSRVPRPVENQNSLSTRAIFGFSPPPPVETKPSPTSQEIMRSRMAFFNAVSEPVRIDARSFLGLFPPPKKEELKPEEEEEEEVTPVGSQEEDEELADEDVEDAMLQMLDRELLEQELRELEDEENRRMSILGSCADEDDIEEENGYLLPVLNVEGASTEEEGTSQDEKSAVFGEEVSSESSQKRISPAEEVSPAEVSPGEIVLDDDIQAQAAATAAALPLLLSTSESDELKGDVMEDILHITEDELIAQNSDHFSDPEFVAISDGKFSFPSSEEATKPAETSTEQTSESVIEITKDKTEETVQVPQLEPERVEAVRLAEAEQAVTAQEPAVPAEVLPQEVQKEERTVPVPVGRRRSHQRKAPAWSFGCFPPPEIPVEVPQTEEPKAEMKVDLVEQEKATEGDVHQTEENVVAEEVPQVVQNEEARKLLATEDVVQTEKFIEAEEVPQEVQTEEEKVAVRPEENGVVIEERVEVILEEEVEVVSIEAEKAEEKPTEKPASTEEMEVVSNGQDIAAPGAVEQLVLVEEESEEQKSVPAEAEKEAAETDGTVQEEQKAAELVPVRTEEGPPQDDVVQEKEEVVPVPTEEEARRQDDVLQAKTEVVPVPTEEEGPLHDDVIQAKTEVVPVPTEKGPPQDDVVQAKTEAVPLPTEVGPSEDVVQAKTEVVPVPTEEEGPSQDDDVVQAKPEETVPPPQIENQVLEAAEDVKKPAEEPKSEPEAGSHRPEDINLSQQGETTPVSSEGSSGDKTDLYTPEDEMKISSSFQSEDSSGEQLAPVMPKVFETSKLLATMEDLEDFEAISTDMMDTEDEEMVAPPAVDIDTESSGTHMDVTEDDKTEVGSVEMLDDRGTEEDLDSPEESAMMASVVLATPLDMLHMGAPAMEASVEPEEVKPVQAACPAKSSQQRAEVQEDAKPSSDETDGFSTQTADIQGTDAVPAPQVSQPKEQSPVPCDPLLKEKENVEPETSVVPSEVPVVEESKADIPMEIAEQPSAVPSDPVVKETEEETVEPEPVVPSEASVEKSKVETPMEIVEKPSTETAEKTPVETADIVESKQEPPVDVEPTVVAMETTSVECAAPCDNTHVTKDVKQAAADVAKVEVTEVSRIETAMEESPVHLGAPPSKEEAAEEQIRGSSEEKAVVESEVVGAQKVNGVSGQMDKATTTEPMEVSQVNDDLDTFSMMVQRNEADDSHDLSDLVKDNLPHINQNDSVLVPVGVKSTPSSATVQEPVVASSAAPTVQKTPLSNAKEDIKEPVDVKPSVQKTPKSTEPVVFRRSPSPSVRRSPSPSVQAPRAADSFINALEDFNPTRMQTVASSTPVSQATVSQSGQSSSLDLSAGASPESVKPKSTQRVQVSEPLQDKISVEEKEIKASEIVKPKHRSPVSKLPTKVSPITRKDLAAPKKAAATKVEFKETPAKPVSKKAAQADAIRRIDALLMKVDKEKKELKHPTSTRRSTSLEVTPGGSATKEKADSSVVEFTVEKGSTNRSFSVDDKFVTSRDRKKRHEKSPSDSSEFTISTPSGSVESTSSVAELYSGGAGSSANGESFGNAKFALSDDSYSLLKTDDVPGYTTADSLSLDNILESGMDDTLSIDYLLDADTTNDVCLDSIVQANTGAPTQSQSPTKKRPPKIVLDGISALDTQRHSSQSDTPTSVVQFKDETSLFTTSGAEDSSCYYTPNASGAEPMEYLQDGATCITPDSLNESRSESRSLGSRGGLSEDTLSDLSDQRSLGSQRTEVPGMSPYSPTRLMDAKRKFFFETSQPLRIDPRSVFKDISSKANEESGRRRSRDSRSGEGKTGLELLGLKRDWKKVESSTPTSPTAAIPHRNSVSGEKDLFYTPGTSVKSRPQTGGDDPTTTKAKKRLLSGPDSSKKKGLTASEIKSDDERLHNKNKQKVGAKSSEGKLGMFSKAMRRPTSAKTVSHKSRQAEESAFRRALSMSDGNTLSDQSEASPATSRKDKSGKKAKTKSGRDEDKDEATGEKKQRRSFLAMLMPSRSVERKEPEPAPKSPTEKDQSRYKKKQQPAVKFRTNKGPKSSAEKKRMAAEEESRKSMYDEFAPLVEGMMGDDKSKKDALQERIEAVAPPPAKAPNTALLPPKATMDDFDTESEFGDNQSLRSFQMQASPQALTDEEQAKLQRKQEKLAIKRQKEAQLKRLRMAQEIQRHLEEVEIKQREVERKGVAIERALRGEGPDASRDEATLMQEWFNIVHEKNALVRYESDLMVHARELELEDRHSRLEQQLRDRMAIDEADKTLTQREEEHKIFQELMEVVEQRDALVALLDDDRKRDAKRVNDLRKMLSTKGFELSPESQAGHMALPSLHELGNGAEDSR